MFNSVSQFGKGKQLVALSYQKKKKMYKLFNLSRHQFAAGAVTASQI